MPDQKSIVLPFPVRGLHEDSALSEQPPGTSPEVLNVRGFDLIARRDRGCQRAGLSRLPNVVNPGGSIDLIRTAMLGQNSASYGGLAFTYTAATMDAAGNGEHTVGTPATNGNYYSSAYKKFAVSASKTAQPSGNQYAVFTPGFVGMLASTITYEAKINYQGGTLFFTSIFSPGNGNYAVSVAVNAAQVVLSFTSTHGNVTNYYPITAIPSANAVFHTEISPTGVVCKVGGTTYLNHAFTSDEQLAANDVFAVGFSSVVYGTATIQLYSGTATPGADLYDLIAITASAASNYDPLSEQICYLQTNGGGVGCIQVGTVVSGFQQIVAGSGTASIYSRASQLDMVAAYGKFWLVDGVNPLQRIDPLAGTVDQPAATAGTLPTLTRILALYHGRLFQGGKLTDPFNYYASRSGDPLDYLNTGTDQAAAFAGNNTLQAGLLGDYLTSMVPFGDLALMMGMGSSIAVMRGDPKAGGDLAIMSHEIGIASLNAWARSPSGDVFFMARDGLYRVSGKLGAYGSVGEPLPMSRGRLDRTLGRIDFTQFRVTMAWDPLELGLKIVIIPYDATRNTTVVFWEERRDAFWVDVITSSIAPRAIASLRGSGGPGGLVLYGGYDGWLRYMSAGAYTDDGTAYSSLVRYPPLTPFGPNARAKLIGMRQLFGNEPGVPFNAVYSVYAADDPVSVQDSDASHSGTITLGGYQSLNNMRARGATLMLELSNPANGKTWQIEHCEMQIMPSGQVRA